MASLTVRNIEEGTKQGLKMRAARNGRSLEEELRTILRLAAHSDEPAERHSGKNWYQTIRKLVEPYGGFELEIPPRGKTMREPPKFE